MSMSSIWRNRRGPQGSGGDSWHRRRARWIDWNYVCPKSMKPRRNSMKNSGFARLGAAMGPRMTKTCQPFTDIHYIWTKEAFGLRKPKYEQRPCSH